MRLPRGFVFIILLMGAYTFPMPREEAQACTDLDNCQDCLEEACKFYISLYQLKPTTLCMDPNQEIPESVATQYDLFELTSCKHQQKTSKLSNSTTRSVPKQALASLLEAQQLPTTPLKQQVPDTSTDSHLLELTTSKSVFPSSTAKPERALPIQTESKTVASIIESTLRPTTTTLGSELSDPKEIYTTPRTDSDQHFQTFLSSFKDIWNHPTTMIMVAFVAAVLICFLIAVLASICVFQCCCYRNIAYPYYSEMPPPPLELRNFGPPPSYPEATAAALHVPLLEVSNIPTPPPMP